jgi:uncharacterized protein YneF (UPF0154 family)
MSNPKINITALQAREALWRMGQLSWLLDKNQQDLYRLFHDNPAKIQTWLLARRSGKSYSLSVLAIEYCLKHPRSIIKYVAPTKMQVERLIRPIISEILSRDCPKDLKPEYHKQQNIYFFPNGSEIQLCGSEAGSIDSIRGGFAHICIVDESQDVSNLGYAVRSVLLPTTLTTKGKILMSGTPPQDADHEFIGFIEKGMAENTLIKRTIYDNPRLSQEDIQLQIEAMGGVNSEDFRREFLCEIIKSKSRSVLPEVTDELLSSIVKEWPRPPYFDSYTSMDVGLKDWTVLLFAYYDFRNDKIIIEDELTAYGPEMHLPVLTKQIRDKEAELWTSPLTGEFLKPKKRISDHNLIVINEIKKFSNYTIFFELADKNEKMAGINWLRSLAASQKIIINPKCKTLIRHMKDGKWASVSSRDTFARCPMGSHYDAIDALVYLVRGMDLKSNPYPRDFDRPLATDAFKMPGYNNNQNAPNADIYRKILNLKRK